MNKRYPLERIYEEVAFIAFHFHWSHEEIMNMEHKERQRWCNEISKINKTITEGKDPKL
jgi:transcriptional antiterminator